MGISRPSRLRFKALGGVASLAILGFVPAIAVEEAPREMSDAQLMKVAFEPPPMLKASEDEFPLLTSILHETDIFALPQIISSPLDPLVLNKLNQTKNAFDKRDPFEFAAQIPPARNTGTAWKIYATEWSSEEERGYQAFVIGLGRTDCGSLDACLTSKANPFHATDDEDEIYYGDCADMAYFLRGYYAWKRGLPFSYQHQLASASGKREDLRYSEKGNIVTGRRDALNKGKPIYAPAFLKRIGGEVSTAMFRTHPETGAHGTHDDFYPVKLSRDTVVPGSIAYDVFGHVGLIFETEDDGRVQIFASHPDYSVTRSLYGANFMRTGPDFGGGLKAWRSIKLVGARKLKDGSYKGGKIIAAPNEDLPGYSLEQYVGNVPDESGDWSLGEFQHKGRTLDYYEYARKKLAVEGYRANPITETRHAIRALCGDLQSRRFAVNRAIYSKVYQKPHPGILPPNIYGTYGTWEAYSTPSRDARLKTSFVEFRTMIKTMIERQQEGNPDFAYSGGDLAADLADIVLEEQLSCKVTYQRTDGSHVLMNMTHVMPRLFDLSFDPYHCPERRWGAAGAELATCEETPAKKRAYEQQQWLRNQATRTYNVKMGFKIEELQSPADASPEEGGLGAATAPVIEILPFLEPFKTPHRRDDFSMIKEIAKNTANKVVIKPLSKKPPTHNGD